MSTWIDPNLLSLVGLGITGDPDLPDGRHLRWFVGAPLGFPRSGFRLRRRPSKALANWDVDDATIQAQWTSQAELGTGPSHRFDSGLTVGKTGWLSYTNAGGTGGPSLRIDSQPVTLDFGPVGAGPSFAPGPNLSNPAAFVRLTILRRRLTGYAVARASYDARGSYQVQDRGAVGTARPGWHPIDWADLVASENGMRLRSSAEASLDPRVHEGFENDAARALARVARGPVLGPRAPGGFIDANPWVTQTVLLRGSYLDHVEITGSDAVLVRVQWVSVRTYAVDPQWTDVDRFYLPLTNAPDLYPVWSSLSGAQVVQQRLSLAAPRRLLPWDDAASSVQHNLAARYQGETFAALDQAMRMFLKGQIGQVVPQSEVAESQVLASNDGDARADMTVNVRPFEHLYASAADPQIARMLGLMTTDLSDPPGVYDYMVDMAVPPLWIRWALFPEQAQMESRDLRERGIDGGNGLLEHMRPDSCLAMVTVLARGPRTPPDTPPDLRADVDPDVAATPVQAHVELSWPAETQSAFDNQGRSRVFYSAERGQGATRTSLLHVDEDNKQLMPLVPTQRNPPDGRLRLMDRAIPAWGTYTWSLRGMDLWGRWSEPGSAIQEVRDTIPPPAPTSIQCSLQGSAAAAPLWDAISLEFDWSASQQTMAPDLDHFEIHLRQGVVERAAAALPGTWGHFEHAAGAGDAPVILHGSTWTLSSLPAGLSGDVTLRAIPTEEGGGSRVVVRIGPVRAAFDSSDRAQVSTTVRAVDRFQNASGYGAHATATRFEESPPVVPAYDDDLAFASMPDAEGRVTYAIRWPNSGSGRVRVLRAAGQALLAAGSVDMSVYDALTPNQQAAMLRNLALAHPRVFGPDHEYPYAVGVGEHRAQFAARTVGLSVFTVELISASEVRSGWPTQLQQFVVVAVRPTPVPSTPLVSEVRAGDRRLTLQVAADPQGDVVKLRLYRTRDAADSNDVRRMRLVRELAILSPTDAPIIVDDGLYADIDYLYRLVALTADGTQSRPSAVLRARPFTSLPPDAPSITSVTRVGLTARRTLSCEIARRDQVLTLHRRVAGELGWTPASGPHVAAGVVDVAPLAPVPTATGYRIDIDDDVTGDPGARYVYRLRVRDARGRSSDSAGLGEAP